MMTLTQLEIFAAAADLEHFTRAATVLHLTQPAVTFQIRNLERALGVALFEVRGRRVILTEAGRLLRARAAVVLGEVEATKRAMRDYVTLGSGVVALGATRTIGGYLLPDLVATYRKQAPDVELAVTIDNTAALEQALVGRNVDLALIEGDVSHPDVQAFAFQEDELVLLARSDDPVALREALTLDDLRGRPFVWREPGSGTRVLAERALAPVLDTLPVALVLDSPEAINRAVEAGLGLAVQSLLIAEQSIAAGRLRALRITGQPMVRSLWLVLLRGRVLSPAAAAFSAMLQEAARVPTARHNRPPR